MDKAGIFVAMAVVAAALGFLATGGTGDPSDIPPTIEESTAPLKEAGQQTKEKLEEISKPGTKVIEEFAEKTKETVEETREFTKSKLPARLVSIPEGTSVPGCEVADLCYDPPSLIIFKGGEVIWRNDDTNAHTVTSGNPIEGPDNIFDSGLLKSDETFSHKFDESGNFEYFCMIHPWASGSIIVE